MKYSSLILLFYIFCCSTLVFSQERDSVDANTSQFIKKVEDKVKEKSKSLVSLSGSVGLSYENYTYSQKNYPTFRARYPHHLGRFNANATLRIGKHFSMPFEVNVTNQKTLYNFPNLPQQGVVDYIQNPQNNISITPTYKWAKLYLGTHTANYSKLTIGDNNMFGAGIELTPGKFIFSFNTGISQREIEADTILGLEGAYRQRVTAARIGVGKLDRTKFVINAVKVEDLVSSLKNPLLYTKPLEGITVSPLLEIWFSDKVILKTETAGSVYTSDSRSELTFENDITKSLSDILAVNATSHADFSNISSLDYRGKIFSIGGEVRYVGPGFVPIGYRNIEKDLIDYKLNNTLRLFQGKTTLVTSVGIRKNNLRSTKLDVNTRFLANVNLSTKITEALSININYSNFGFTTDTQNPLLKNEITNNSYAISPVYRFTKKAKTHVISGNLSLNAFNQYDILTTSYQESQTKVGMLNYALIFKTKPLTMNGMVMYMNNTLPVATFNMMNIAYTIGYKFFKKKLNTSLTLNYALTNRPTFTGDKRISSQFKANYALTKKLGFQFQYGLLNNQFGTYLPNARSTENKIEVSIIQKF